MPSFRMPNFRFLIPRFRAVNPKTSPEELKQIIDSPQTTRPETTHKFVAELRRDYGISLKEKSIAEALNDPNDTLLKTSVINSVTFAYNIKLLAEKSISLQNAARHIKTMDKKFEKEISRTSNLHHKTQLQEGRNDLREHIKTVKELATNVTKLAALFTNYLQKETQLFTKISDLKQERIKDIKKDKPELDDKTIKERMEKLDNATTLKEKLEAGRSLTANETKTENQNPNVSYEPNLKPSLFAKSTKQKKFEKDLVTVQNKMQKMDDDLDAMGVRFSQASFSPKWSQHNKKNYEEESRQNVASLRPGRSSSSTGF